MTQKVALVTGAGSGIGRCTALALAKVGYKVVLTGRHAATLEQTAAMAELTSQVSIHVADITRPQDVEDLFAHIQATSGRLDLLFNNAGTNTSATLFEDLSYDQWQQVVSVNLTGTFLCTQQAFKLMKNQTPQGGRIINNGSISAQVPRPNSAPYTSTKHAVAGLTKSIALDGRKYNIACGQIDIGNASTAMTTKMSQGVPQADGTMASEPTMQVTHVADAVVYMAGLPLDANVLSLTVMASAMPYVGRG